MKNSIRIVLHQNRGIEDQVFIHKAYPWMTIADCHCSKELHDDGDGGTWYCTRDPKHEGPHAAHNGAEIEEAICAWFDDDEEDG